MMATKGDEDGKGKTKICVGFASLCSQLVLMAADSLVEHDVRDPLRYVVSKGIE